MEKIERIPKITGFIMLGLALIFDVLQLIFNLTVILAFFASVIALIGWVILWFWFKLRGVTFSDNANRMMVATISPLIEAVPFINMLPGLTLGTFFTITSVRAEDKIKNAEQKQAREANKAASVVENKKAAAYYNRRTANDNQSMEQRSI